MFPIGEGSARAVLLLTLYVIFITITRQSAHLLLKKISFFTLFSGYILFLKKMKTKFGTINWEDENREQTLAKAIDEYNYIEANE